METIVKKYIWIINIIAAIFAAYIISGIVNDVIVYSIFKTPKIVTEPVKQAADFNPREPLKDEMAQVIVDRGLFNLDAVDNLITEPENPGDVEKVNTEESIAEALDIQLIGTMVAADKEWSMATISTGKQTQIVRIGLKVNDQVEILDIQRRYIVIQQNGETKIVKLWAEKKNKPMNQQVTPQFQQSQVENPENNQPGQDYSKGVTKTGPFEFTVSKQMLEDNLNDLSKLGMDARIVPNYVNNKYEGFKLIGIRPNSLYRAIGMRSGDIIKSINGEPIDSPNKAIQLFETMKNSSEITLGIERRGQKQDMTYTIQ
jgi:type II secretion system protein C